MIPFQLVVTLNLKQYIIVMDDTMLIVTYHGTECTYMVRGVGSKLRGGEAGPGGGVAAPLVHMRISRSSILVMVTMVN
jgi:hypothetical protein